MFKKRQRNSLYECLLAAHLDPSQFNLNELDLGSELVVQIDHKQGDSFFAVSWDRPERYQNTEYRITTRVGDEAEGSYHAGQWSDIEEAALEWARDLEYFLNSPDLWAELRREQEILSGTEYERMSNAQFTADEQLRITQQLREIKSNLAEQYSLSGERLSQVEAKLDEVEEASHRLGRKDWLNIFLGVMFTLIATAILPPEAIQHIIANVIHGLPDLFGFSGGPPPSIPPVA